MKPVQRLLLQWYATMGRASLPWRSTRDPYRVIVSEFMLQQTQVDRVVPKYAAFVATFPDARALADASTAEVLRSWKGLGYNSRAIRLQQLAREIRDRFDGRVPHEEPLLRSLPGVGPYTVAAVRAFAFNLEAAAIDTNALRVVHRLMYGPEYPAHASRRELADDARRLVPRGRAHDWNSAIMDLGATLCTARAPKCLICPLQSVCSAAPIDSWSLDQARKRHIRAPSGQQALAFEQTRRFARGRIIDRLRLLRPHERIRVPELLRELCPKLRRTPAEIGAIIEALTREGLIEVRNQEAALPE